MNELKIKPNSGCQKIYSIVDLQYLEVSSLFFVSKSQLFHKPTNFVT